MSTDDTISLKEFMTMKFSEISKNIKTIGDNSSRGLEKINLISERVDNHEQKLKHIIEVLESHNTMLVMDEGKQQQKKEEEMKQLEEIKRRDTRIKWQLGIIIPMGLSVLGYFGYLYIEHIKAEIIAQTSQQMITLLVTTYNIR